MFSKNGKAEVFGSINKVTDTWMKFTQMQNHHKSNESFKSSK